MNQNKKYDVALSFAGEDRSYVEMIAGALVARGIKVFYDDDEKTNLWGKNLYEYLIDVYKNRAKYTVIFISANYKNKMWTNHERRAAQARAIGESYEYILPARFDDTEIDSVLSTTGYIDLRKHSPFEVAVLICEKLGQNLFEVKAHSVPSPKSPLLSGEAKFDYSSYNGRFRIGDGHHLFETIWSKASNVRIHCYTDTASIRGVALVPMTVKLNEITQASTLDFTSRVRSPEIGQYLIVQNNHGLYAALKILDIKDNTRSDVADELTFYYWILTAGSDNFSNISDKSPKCVEFDTLTES
ncbi:toll/interleukin-1 receptor domain-containing protein [Leptolyngbya sp. FACHB-261]|uniref:toll/interleukin-1 receptor domain-containing protein n=1 Tax=Leptolyngbya sp. FACHB-261 TaxID=2692806 RepID=UPI0016887C60|nr:TIR domain-containing protein [Leptolyngbya sp. FACHB-261]MBD2104490.1 TIR domain-containing protein [Leptolyngbya sp. FACHB-261]